MSQLKPQPGDKLMYCKLCHRWKPPKDFKETNSDKVNKECRVCLDRRYSYRSLHNKQKQALEQQRRCYLVEHATGNMYARGEFIAPEDIDINYRAMEGYILLDANGHKLLVQNDGTLQRVQ